MSNNKILQVLTQEEYYSPKNGGAIATWVKEFSSELVEYETTVCAPFSDTPFKVNNLKQIKTKFAKSISKYSGAKIGHHLKYNTYVILVGLFARRKKYKIIHVHNRPNYIPIIKRLNPNAKVMLHMHNDHVFDANHKQINDLYTYCDKIISVSGYIQNGILKKGADHNLDFKSKCAVLLNGSNPDHFVRTLPAKNNQILFIGRLDETKGIKQLIEAVLLVKKKISTVKLIIAGSAGFGNMEDSPFVKSLKELTKNDKENFDFLGYVDHDDVPDLFKKVALYCIPSIWNDPCPLSVIEGMASGIPMIVGDRGGIPEEVGDAAIKLNCEDVTKLANTIIYALENDHEMKLLADKAHKRFTNNFTWKHVTNNYIKIIDKL
ncbi:glycosyltransferase family 4 protein [Polaribacter sp. Asnod1-A03]|uniref:glycosyltransferase family 4 protein n=1 Tax=Polaribacter sp. Asnod1-A03 TaxID=3160581 RepID=UPI00386C9CDD